MLKDSNLNLSQNQFLHDRIYSIHAHTAALM